LWEDFASHHPVHNLKRNLRDRTEGTVVLMWMYPEKIAPVDFDKKVNQFALKNYLDSVSSCDVVPNSIGYSTGLQREVGKYINASSLLSV